MTTASEAAPNGKGEIATPASTRRALLEGQRRGYTAVRSVLVQLPEADERGGRDGVLARFVHERRHHALLAYLLLLGSFPEIHERREPLSSAVWVRALTGSDPACPTWTASTLSRTWGVLEDMGLISRRRRARLVDVQPRREDGQQDYAPPVGGKSWEETYFVVPDQFWTEGLFSKLSLPALAMFLLLLKETNKRPEFHITFNQIEQWYGITRRSAQNGIAQLKEQSIVSSRDQRVAAPLAPSGTTTHIYYQLTGPYSTAARNDLRRLARAARSEHAPGSDQ